MRMELARDGQRYVQTPRTAHSRGAVTYLKILRTVTRDTTWGGWRFEGELMRPGDCIGFPSHRLLAIECVGSDRRGYGHRRSETLYILWRFEDGAWCELGRSSSANRDWTLDLGPIARRALHPPRPILIDPDGLAERLLRAVDEEIEPLDAPAKKAVLNAVYDRVAARVVA